MPSPKLFRSLLHLSPSTPTLFLTTKGKYEGNSGKITRVSEKTVRVFIKKLNIETDYLSKAIIIPEVRDSVRFKQSEESDPRCREEKDITSNTPNTIEKSVKVQNDSIEF